MKVELIDGKTGDVTDITRFVKKWKHAGFGLYSARRYRAVGDGRAPRRIARRRRSRKLKRG